jgi:acetyl esterase/lipase
MSRVVRRIVVAGLMGLMLPVLTAGAAQASCAVVTGVTVTCGVVYNSTDGQTLDVYEPTGATADPVVLVIHGGEWAHGNSGGESGLAGYLAQHGFVAMALNYTLVNGSTGLFPAGLNDVETASTWAVAHASSWGGDGTKVVALGESAGANLADELANLTNTSTSKPYVRAAVGWSAPTDLTGLVNACPTSGCQPGSPGQVVEAYLGCTPTQCPTSYAEASPASNVSAGSAPQLIVNSTDEAIILGQAQELDSLLQSSCVTHEYTVIPGDQHAATYIDLMQAPSDAFLKAALAGTVKAACPTPPLPPQTGAASVWDAALGKAILFGGCCNNAGNPIATTWELVSNKWTKVTTKGSPSARLDASIVYDAALGKVVLYGGMGAPSKTGGPGVELGDTWTFDGTTWTKVTSTGPAARDSAATAWDNASGDVVLYGGQNYPANALAPQALTDTWTFNGTLWKEASSGGGTGQPPGRYGAAMASDPTSGHVVLFGGNTTTGSSCNGSCLDLLNDTWTWNGTAWTQVKGTSPTPARDYSVLAEDVTTGTDVLFGGMAGTSAGGSNTDSLLADTWTWNGSSWTQVTGGTVPPARFAAALTYDSSSGGRLVLSAGYQGSTTQSNVLYAWNGSWSKL